MWTHPTDAALMDVVEGNAREGVLDHVARCPRCRQRAEDAGAALSWTRGAAIPDPVPAYWDRLRRQVAAGIADAAPPARHGRFWTAGLLAAAAAVALVMVVPTPTAKVLAPRPAAAVLPAWSALPPAEDDAGLVLLEHAAPAAAAAAPSLECTDLAACVAGLSDDESRALADALRDQLGAEGRL